MSPVAEPEPGWRGKGEGVRGIYWIEGKEREPGKKEGEGVVARLRERGTPTEKKL